MNCKIKTCERAKRKLGYCEAHYMRNRVHGHPQTSIPIPKHGCSGNKKRTPEYVAWNLMKSRCNNPKNPDSKSYAGRGIKVCSRWANFQKFLKDMGPKPSSRHSIDRKNNDKGYSPSNCRWATPKQQANNRRQRSINVIG